VGGTVNWTLRTEDGSVFSRQGHTNVFGWKFQDLKFIEGDSSFFQNGWRKTDMGVGPVGYGMILADYRNRTLRSLQGYTDFVSLFCLDFADEPMVYPAPSEWPEKRLIDLIQAGRVTRKKWDRDQKKFVISTGVSSWEKENSFLTSVSFRVAQLYQYTVDLSPWTIVHYPESLKGLDNLRQDLLDTGFEIGQAEFDQMRSELEDDE